MIYVSFVCNALLTYLNFPSGYDHTLRNICEQEGPPHPRSCEKLLKNSKHVPDSQEDVTGYKAAVDNSLMHRCDVTNTLPSKSRSNLN